jgi:hypothetical protein
MTFGIGWDQESFIMLRDHFRPPLDDMRHWESLHGGWPMMIVAGLRRKLPAGYFAELRVHLGKSAEIDVATFEGEESRVLASREDNGGGVATAVWAPPRPTLVIAADLPAQDVFEVLVYDERRHSRLVAAVEIVSPANKDRPEHRRLFVAKCAALLQQRVSVAIVDIVTTRSHNLYGDLLELIGKSDPALKSTPPPLYATACRITRHENDWFLETWFHSLELGRPLPTLPLWLADDLAVPLELNESYEQSCGILSIP